MACTRRMPGTLGRISQRRWELEILSWPRRACQMRSVLLLRVMTCWVRIVALLAVAGLLANSRCQALCFASSGNAATAKQQEQGQESCPYHQSALTPSGSGHSAGSHSLPSNHERSGCHDRFVSSASIETAASSDNVSSPQWVAIATSRDTPASVHDSGHTELGSLFKREQPPDKPLFLLLSMLRL